MNNQFQTQHLRNTKVQETSATGGGTTGGAAFTPGTGEQYASTGAFKKKMKESASELATVAKLVLQAKKDGYIAGDYSQAVLSAAKKVGSKFDELKPEEQKVMRDKYYDLFLQAANLKKAGVQEDAPMLAHGKADISTYTQDNFKKVEGHADLKSIEPKDLWGTLPTAMSEELEEIITRKTKEKLDNVLQRVKDSSPKIYDYILDLIADIYPHDDEVEALVAKAGLQENYHRFKRQTKERSKQDQYHEAIKAINKKLDEVNRILEFTSRMKEELSEGEETLEMKSRTTKTLDKTKTKVAEAYKKLKHLN